MNMAAPVWTISPLRGLDNILFGMDRASVALHLGPAEASDIDWRGRLNETRGVNKPSCSFINDGLVAIGLSPRVGPVFYAGFDLFSFSCEAAIRHLVDQNGGSVRFGLETFVFDRLAMTAGDYWNAEKQKWFEPRAGRKDPRGITFEAVADPDWDIESFPPMKL